MFPLIPALVLGFISFIASAFVILRIIIPILPPHPLSKRVSPAEFGLPTFRSLSPADKSHIWLASLDLLALAIFMWQVVTEATGGPADFATTSDPASAVRIWLTVTVRQSCLFIIAAITLLHVRLGKSVSFGARHWMLWTPTLLLVVTSTALAGVLSGAGVMTLYWGIIGYCSFIAMSTSIAFGCLFGTLFIIKRNLSALNEHADPWPPVREVEEKPRPSFATEEIDAIRDGASWITSNGSVSSRRNSMSAWSFSTHHTAMASSQHGHGGRAQTGSHPSVPAKSSFWFGSTTIHDTNVPPVPPLPSPYGPLSPTAEILRDSDPFRRDIPTPLPDHPRHRLGSQTSWLTSTNGSHTTMSAWSYPASHYEGTLRNGSSPDLHTALTAVSRPVTPAMADAQVLGGYGYGPGSAEMERGLSSLSLPNGATTVDVSIYPIIGWLIMIWIPIGLAYPYFFIVSQNSSMLTVANILFILSITLSSPLLALNILFDSPLPIPIGLFDARNELPTNMGRASTPRDSNHPYKYSYEYKRSMSTSVTVVEGRRSGDVWLANGDAVDGKGKLGRAVGLLNPKPKLSVLPPEDQPDAISPLTPPLPMQNEDSSLPVNISTPHSETSAQFGRLRTESKASSHYSGGDESMAFASRIMIAQRHYSALAQTVVVPAGSSPDKNESVEKATGTESTRQVGSSNHLRARSVSSISGPDTPTAGETFRISPPPSFPLPPTPPNVRAARLAKLAHKKSFSSGFSFGPVDDLNEIDALTAGVLPLLVPGLKVGGDMKIKEGDWTPPGSFSKSKGKKQAKKMKEFGEDFSSPEIHSTPARRQRAPRQRRESGHKRNHFSLPSLSLGKDGMHSLATWSADIRGALEHKVGQYTAVPSNVELGWRNTVFGADSVPTEVRHLQVVREEDERPQTTRSGLGRALSTRSLGLNADVPHNVHGARSSVVSSTAVPTSAASTVTLFEDFEAGLDSGPQAESTPHNTVSQKPSKRNGAPSASSKRSSIVYIKPTNDHTANAAPAVDPPMSALSSFTQWSSRAVRPLIPKASKLQRTMSSSNKPGTPREGLRPLALLQDRDPNTIGRGNESPVQVDGTRPLTLGKRQKSRNSPNVSDENSIPDSSSSRSQNLKPLKLARSETSKVRGILRKSEVLPDVVVRPPSTADSTPFVYSFHE